MARSGWLVLAAVLLCASAGVARRIERIVHPGSDFFDSVGLDAAGNVYVYFRGGANNRVERIDPSGVTTVLIGPAGDGLGNVLDCPGVPGYICDMLVTPAGDVYVTAGGSDNVFHVDPAGVVTEVIDAAGDGAGNPLDFPFGIALDATGNLIVAGISSHNVFKVAPGGGVTHLLSGLTAFIPHVAADAAGNVFVGDDDAVLRIDGTGAVSTVIDASGDGLGNVFDDDVVFPVVDAAGNVYVSGRFSDNVFAIAPDGTIDLLLDASGDGLGNPLVEPLPPSVDSQGVVWVGTWQGDVFRVDTSGAVERRLTGLGSGIPIRTLLDPLDRLYVMTNNRVLFVTDSAVRTLIDEQGDGRSPAALFEYTSRTAVPTGDGAYVGARFTTFTGYTLFHVQRSCDPAPRAGCRLPVVPGVAKLVVKDVEDESRDALIWKWPRGQATELSAFGDPATVEYSLCLYGGGDVLIEASASSSGACAAGACWTPTTAGFKYADLERGPDGVRKAVFKSGLDRQAKVTLDAKGVNVPDDVTLPIAAALFPLTAQLQASNGECWQATYASSDVTRNLATKLVARGQ
jgi:hypothetical protein